MIFAPPRHGKSEFVSKYFPAWYLGTFPDRRVIVASHNADLATGFSEQARDLLERWGPKVFGRQVRADKRAIGDWKIAGHDGGMEAFGVGGGMLGKGCDLLVIDDPITGTKARSPAERENLHEWWLSTARNRLNPGGKAAVIIMQQRLHEDDLAGRLMARFPGRWEVCNLRAEAEEDDPLGRRLGEWLWPWGFPEADYEELKSGDPWYWATSYQQRPVPRGGGMIQVAWIEDNAVRYTPADADARVRYWDFASTEDGGDYTVGVLMSRKGDHFYIEDVVRGQWGPTNRDRIIRSTCVEDNARYPNAIVTIGERQPSGSGKDMGVAFEKLLVPFSAHSEPLPSGDKTIRADGLAGAFGRGEVHVVRGTRDDPRRGAGQHRGPDFDWYAPLVAELSSFPACKHDDIVDACAGGFNKLALDVEPCGYAAISQADYLDLVSAGEGYW